MPVHLPPAPIRSWSPARLPHIRDQLYRDLDLNDSTGGLITTAIIDITPRDRLALDHMRRALPGAALYWVTEPMAHLAAAAAPTLPEVDWSTPARPAPTGLLVWEGGIGALPIEEFNIPVDCMWWGPHPDGLLMVAMASRPTMARFARAAWGHDAGWDADAVMAGLPVLLPLGVNTGNYTAGPMTVTPGYADATIGGSLCLALSATWALMQQPVLTDHTPARVDRKIRAGYARASRPDPQVTIVNLRRAYAPTHPHEPDGIDEHGRIYRHRWVVSGHWRQQPHGPGRALRRQQWIPAHVKGPDGAPLIETERVNVWRR